MKRAEAERGFVLVPVVLALAIVGVIAFLLTRTSAIETDMAAGEAAAVQARYLAEAGLRHASWKLDAGNCMDLADLPTTAFGAGSYGAVISDQTPGPPPTSYVAPVDQDTWLDELSPSSSNGSDDRLRVNNQVGESERALLRFDLSAVPPAQVVVSAVAHFYVKDNDDTGAVGVHRVVAAWADATASWSTSANDFDPVAAASIPPQSSGDVWVELPITGLVQSWLNGSPNYGVMLVATSADRESRYMSRESSTASERPWLEVLASPAGGNIRGGIEATGTTASGARATIRRDGQTVYQAEQTLVLQPGPNTEDTYLWDGTHRSKNFGIASILGVNTASAEQVSLLRFDLSSLPTSARVKQATLALYLEGGIALNGALDVHRLTRAWVEGDQNDQTTTSGASYEKASAFVYWTSLGGDYQPSSVASTTVSGLTPGWIEWDVTSAAQAWTAQPADNLGAIVRGSAAGTVNKIVFTSGDSGTATQWPRLTLTLRCPCGEACGATAGPDLLLVVVDPASLTTQEAAKQTLIESWGYAVNLIDVDASQAAFDAAVAESDVVYITEDIAAAALGTKLTNAAIGVVTDEDNLSDEFGMTASISWGSGTQLNITNNTHYITSGLALAPLTVFSPAQSLAVGTGSVSVDLIDLASAPTRALFALEEGAATYGASASAGRRVQLPWGGDAFSLASLNSDGRTIMQRAIEWGAGAAPLVPTPGCDATFRDSFGAKLYTNSTGTQAWSTAWLEVAEADGPTAGDEQIIDDSQGRALQVQDNDGGGEGVQRQADLSGRATATLSLRYKRINLSGPGDYVKVEVSNNGGAAWVELARIGNGVDAAFIQASYNITPFIASNTRVRFLSSPTLGGGDRVLFDDVEICATD